MSPSESFLRRQAIDRLRQQTVRAAGAQDATVDQIAAGMRADINALAARVPQTRIKLSEPLPLLAVNAAVDVTVEWSTPFPTDAYGMDATPLGTLLGKVRVTPKSRTAAAGVFTVTSTSLVAIVAGSQILAVATC